MSRSLLRCVLVLLAGCSAITAGCGARLQKVGQIELVFSEQAANERFADVIVGVYGNDRSHVGACPSRLPFGGARSGSKAELNPPSRDDISASSSIKPRHQ